MTLAAHDASMMTQQLGFSILTAPLAALDRRALSQAWYSALHLARESTHRDAPAAAGKPMSRRTGAPALNVIASAGAKPYALPATPRRMASRVLTLSGERERRAPRSGLARKIARCFLDPARRVQRATFTIDGSNARVHIALQSRGAAMRLVAVCPPALRDRVQCALEEARYALCARGIALDLDVHGEPA